MNNCSSDLSPFMPHKDFSELLWEKGQIVTQGQSNRPCKRSFKALSSQASKFEERVGRDGGSPKNGQFGVADTAVSELSHAVPSGHIGLNAQVADMGPWINYPIEDNDYPPEFFSEFTGVNLNSLSALSNTIPSDRSSGFGHPIRDLPSVEHRHASKSLAGDSEASRIRTGELFPLSQQWQSSVPSSSHQVPCGNSQAESVQKQAAGSCRPAQQSSSVGLRNFPHFSRPVAHVISNLQSVDESRSNVKASTAASSRPMGSTVINSASGLKGLSVIKGQSAPVPPKPPREVASGEQSEAVFEKDTCRNKKIHNITGSSTRSPDHIHHQSSNAVAFVRRETEKGPEAVVASSSVCSANSAGAELNDPTHAMKRKDREGEESGYQSEDLENESVGLKKVATGRGMSTKRSRAAEVHNLSERRRRDRINEKMRALQELIPNCNRVDKASMLDEAIEYLKTLQLQVQIMSMGSGLCMHPMMLPAGMQHLLPPPMAHFSPMSVNMGLGYGMGMNGSSTCPMMPVRPMHGPQFHYPSMPVHGMPGSTGLQMFGIPGQGIPVSMPNPPPFGPLSGFTARVNMVPDIRGATTSPLPVADTAPSSNSTDQEQLNIS